MTTSLLAAAVFCAFAMLLVFAGAASAADPFTPQGQATIKVLDAMGVESKWLGGEQNGSPANMSIGTSACRQACRKGRLANIRIVAHSPPPRISAFTFCARRSTAKGC